jgi:hypothetical protein
MTRVLLEDFEDDATVGAKSTNGYHAPVGSVAEKPALDVRRAISQRDDNRHKPRRTRTAYTRRIGPYSRPHAIAEIDQRTVEAALMRRVRDELTEHCGGHPTVVERLLIERATILSLRVAQIDVKILAGEVLTLHDNQHALSWFNALRRTLVELGLQPPASVANRTDLSDWVQNRQRKSRVA